MLQAFATSVKGMEIRMTPEQEAQLAAHLQIDPHQLVMHAALRLIDDGNRFRAAVGKGVEQADRGEFIEEAEMDARVERMLRR
jgi:predicted transcriptional regulator